MSDSVVYWKLSLKRVLPCALPLVSHQRGRKECFGISSMPPATCGKNRAETNRGKYPSNRGYVLPKRTNQFALAFSAGASGQARALIFSAGAKGPPRRKLMVPRTRGPRTTRPRFQDTNPAYKTQLCGSSSPCPTVWSLEFLVHIPLCRRPPLPQPHCCVSLRS